MEEDSIQQMVREVLEEVGLPVVDIKVLDHTAFMVPNERGGLFLVEALSDEKAQEAQFRCGLGQVRDERRVELVELMNDLNTQYKPFVRWSLVGGVAGVQVGCELMFAEHPKQLLGLAVARIMAAIHDDAQRVLLAVEHGYNPAAEAVAEADRLTGGKSAAAE